MLNLTPCEIEAGRLSSCCLLERIRVVVTQAGRGRKNAILWGLVTATVEKLMLIKWSPLVHEEIEVNLFLSSGQFSEKTPFIQTCERLIKSLFDVSYFARSKLLTSSSPTINYNKPDGKWSLSVSDCISDDFTGHRCLKTANSGVPHHFLHRPICS